MRNLFLATMLLLLGAAGVKAQVVDYSVVNALEERGIDFMQITQPSDYVCMPIVQRQGRSISWLSNRILDVSVDGKYIAYVSARNGSTNIFIKELGKQGGATQRTNRQSVLDFAYSPDGKQICFSENRGKSQHIFITDANVGYVCRQITSANSDYSQSTPPTCSRFFLHAWRIMAQAFGATTPRIITSPAMHQA